MKTFQDILKEQLEIPAQVFGKDPVTGAKVVVNTISPIEAMVKSVMKTP